MRKLMPQIHSFPSALLRACIALLFTALLAVQAGHARAAEPVTSVEAGQLAELPQAQARLVALGTHTLALGPAAAWRLSADGKQWLPLALPEELAGQQVVHEVPAGAQSWWLLQAAEGTQRLARASLSGAALALQPGPALPRGLRATQLALLGEQLYVAGIDEAGRTVLYRRTTAAAGEWALAPVWPGGAAPKGLQAQRGALFALAGDEAGGDALWRWSADKGWQPQPAPAGRVLEGSLRALGQAHLMLLQAGDDGAARLRSFHVITGAWAELGAAGSAAPAQVLRHGDGLLWAEAGQSAPRYLQLRGGKHLLRGLDWGVIVVYLAIMLGMGFWFYFRDKNTNTADFFVGGRSIPFWAAGISLYATNTSSISFIAIPAKAFDTNWQYLTNNLMAVLGLVFVAIWIVPLLRRLDLMSVFSYLETRFHPAIRVLSSALCIAMQVGARMSVILFLPALAIATITGLDVVWSIMLMGVFTIIYSTVGGSKAVIWTDVVQVVVMFGGALFAIGYVFWSAGGDLPALVDAARLENKTKLFDFSFDLTKATVWGFIFLVVFDVVLTFPKDQVLMQRTLSTRDDKAAGRSIWAFAAMMIPGGFVFYGIGTALWMYYKDNPERLNPLLPVDATFPLFIAAELPAGVTGLIIAGIFAAAMSTLSSIINSVGTLVSVDFYQKLAKDPDEKTAVRIAEWAGVMVGVTGIVIALVMSRYDIQSLFDVSIELAGLLGGGFAGAYTLGMFTRRANAQGVAIGVAGSIVITLLCWWNNLVHPYFYLGISIALCIVIGYLASLLFPAPTRSLEGLTIHSRGKAAAKG